MKDTRINLAVLSLPQRTQAVMEFFITKDGHNKFVLVAEDRSDVAVFDFDNPVSFKHWQRYQVQFGKPGILLSVSEQKLPMTVWVQKPVTTQSMLEAATKINRLPAYGTQITSPSAVTDKPKSLFNSIPKAEQATTQKEGALAGLKLATLSLPKRTQAVMEFFISNDGRGKFVLSPEDKSDVAVFDFDNPDSLQHWQNYRSSLSKPGILLSVSEQRLPMTVWVQKPVTTQSMLEAAAKMRAKAWTLESDISDVKISAPESQFSYKFEPEPERKPKQETLQKSAPSTSTPKAESLVIPPALVESKPILGITPKESTTPELKLATLSLPKRTQAVMEFFISNDGRGKFVLSPEDKSDVAVFDFDNPDSLQHWQNYRSSLSKPGILLSVSEQRLPMTVWVQKPVTTQSMLEAAAKMRAKAWTLESDISDVKISAPESQFSYKFEPEPERKPKQETLQKSAPSTSTLKAESLVIPPALEAVFSEPELSLTKDNKEVSGNEITGSKRVKTNKPFSTKLIVAASAKPNEEPLPVEPAVEPVLPSTFADEFVEAASAKPDEEPLPVEPTVEPVLPSTFADEFIEAASAKPDEEPLPVEPTVEPVLPSTFADEFVETAAAKPNEEPLPVEPTVEPVLPSTFADEFVEAAAAKPNEEPLPVGPTVEPVLPSTFADEFVEAAAAKPNEEPLPVEPTVEPVLPSTFADEFVEAAVARPDEVVVGAAPTIDPAPVLPTPSETIVDATVTVEKSMGTSSTVNTNKRNLNESPIVSQGTNATTHEVSTEEDSLYFGNRLDVSAGEISRSNNLFFDYEEKLISALRETFIVANRWRSPTRLEINSGFLIFDPIEMCAYLDFPEEVFWDQLKVSHSATHKINTVGIREYAEIQLKSESMTRIEQFDTILWKSALLTSQGCLPSGTNLNKVFYLKYRPDMTHLQPIPHDQRIAELWAFRGASLLDTAKILGIPQRYVFAYYNATLAIDLVTDDGKLRQENSGGSVLSSIFKRLSH